MIKSTTAKPTLVQPDTVTLAEEIADLHRKAKKARKLIDEISSDAIRVLSESDAAVSQLGDGTDKTSKRLLKALGAWQLETTLYALGAAAEDAARCGHGPS